MDATPTPEPRRCQLRFSPLLGDGQATLAFPCDKAGRVDLDALGGRARLDYLYARTVVGRTFARPTVLIEAHH